MINVYYVEHWRCDIEVMNIIEGQLPHDKIKRHWKRQQCESILRTYCPSFKSTRKAEMIFVNEDKSFFLSYYPFISSDFGKCGMRDE